MSSTSLAARRPRRGGGASGEAEPPPLPPILPPAAPPASVPEADTLGLTSAADFGAAPLLDGVAPSSSSTAGPVAALAVADAGADAAAVEAVVNRRILPVFIVFTAVNYLDRTAVAFAAPGLKAALPLTDSQYGAGSSLFFAGYFLAQVPLVAAAVASGSPVPALAAACVAWGVAAAATAFVTGPTSFYVARIVLGVAEAPAFPLMWSVLATFSATPAHLSAWYACVTATIAAAQVLGGPVAAVLLSLDGTFGLAGWQILFLFEAAPTLAVAAWAWKSLPRSPAAALPPDARTWLVTKQRAAAAAAAAGSVTGRSARVAAAPADDHFIALRQPRLWALGGLESLVSVSKFSLLFFSALILDAVLSGAAVRHAAAAHESHAAPPAHRAAAVAALTAIPFGLAALSTVLNARHAKRTRERRWHVVWPVAACALGLAGLGLALPHSAAASLAALTVGAQVYAASGVVASYPASMLGGPGGGAAAAVGYAFSNAVAATGGAAGPAVFGALRDASGGYTVPCFVMAGVAATAAALYSIVLPLLVSDDAGAGGGASPRDKVSETGGGVRVSP